MANPSLVSSLLSVFILMVVTISMDLTHARVVGKLKHFEISDPHTGKVCILLDIDFVAEIRAMKDGKQVGVAYLTPGDDGVTSRGVCQGTTHEILVAFSENTFWALAFQPANPHPLGMYRSLQFDPSEVFGSTIDVSVKQGFADSRPVFLENDKDSFKCGNWDSMRYFSYSPTPSPYNFTVTVNVTSIQTQGFNIQDGRYGPVETCA